VWAKVIDGGRAPDAHWDQPFERGSRDAASPIDCGAACVPASGCPDEGGAVPNDALRGHRDDAAMANRRGWRTRRPCNYAQAFIFCALQLE
jgi:hypothetical protein